MYKKIAEITFADDVNKEKFTMLTELSNMGFKLCRDGDYSDGSHYIIMDVEDAKC